MRRNGSSGGIKFKALLIPLLFLLALTEPAYAQKEVFRINVPLFELYAPARVIMQFQYTQDVSIRVTTVGASLYRATTSPTQIQVEMENFDMYTITINIAYSTPVNQTIVVGLFEGGRAAKSLEFQTASQRIEIQMRISVVAAPSYPTAEEIAENLIGKLRNEITAFEQRQSEVIDKMSMSIMTVGSLAVIAFTIASLCLYAVYRIHGKTAEMEAIYRRSVRS